MQKIFILISSLFLVSSLEALYNSNPFEPEVIKKGMFFKSDDLLSVKVGYQGDFVLDRQMKAYSGASGRIDNFDFLMNQGVVTLNFGNRFEVYGSMGALGAHVKCRLNPGPKIREFQTHNQLTWGVGGRAVLLRLDHTDIGISGSFQYAHPHLAWDSVKGAGYAGRGRLRYQEWQIGVGVAHQIDLFYPYLAVNYSKAHALLNHLDSRLELAHNHFKMHNRDLLGMAIGCTLATSDILDLTVEVRMIDEQALTLSGNIRL